MNDAAVPRSEADSPKRQLVLDAAAELFIAQGYGTVSMDAIARSAGVSKATLYAHFGSKDALFATIIKEACRANFDWETVLPASESDVRAALTGFGQRILSFLLEERALAIYRVVVAECVRFPELGRAFFEGGPATAHKLFGQWAMDGTRAGKLRIADPLIAAEQFMSLLRAGVHLRAILGVPPPPSEAEIDATVAAAVATFLAAYGASERPCAFPIAG